MKIPFNKPYMTGKEPKYMLQAYRKGQLSGNGIFTKKCHRWLEKNIGCEKAFLTHSCTTALEMAAVLIDIRPGDEVIMPSYTFVSTANAFVLFGAKPVFVDIRPDTLNLDETKVAAAITPKTRAIVPVHYAGVSCEMDEIISAAEKYNLFVIEDAAHGILSSYKGRHLGSLGHLAALSFHETKNIISGEGGALLVNDASLKERSAFIWEKGTNRINFFLGKVDKYTWVDKGSSYLPSELTAAFLWAQMEEAKSIITRRMEIWQCYHKAFQQMEEQGLLRRPIVPGHCRHTAHMYYILLNDPAERKKILSYLGARGVGAIFHYIPLHLSVAGKRYARTCGDLKETEKLSQCLIRLPLWAGMKKKDVMLVIDSVYGAVRFVKRKKGLGK